VDNQQQPRGRATRQQLVWSIRIAAVLTVAVLIVLIGYRYGITLWDWIKLLVVPAVIAAGGLWFNRQQQERELRTAERRAQDEALQAYLDQMSNMLIPTKDRPSLYDENPPESLRTVARARTLTMLSRLDGDRKARVVQFLYESGLISRERPVLELSLADLSHANLVGTNLSAALLSAALLNNAGLTYANLSSANLSSTNLMGANLIRANLDGANLAYANVTVEQLQQADTLEGATMPNGQKYEEWLKDREIRGEDGKNSGRS
jgi:hypothetical protein